MRSSDRFTAPGVACRLSGREFPVGDLSVGGFFVRTEEGAPPPGQFLELELCLGARAPLRVIGKVVWRDDTGTRRHGAPKGFGVQIARIDLRDKLALVDWLRRLPTRAAHPVQ